MDRNAVLAKTAKGLEEVKSRTHGLAQKQRAMLIMVDGVATVGDILAKFGGIPDVDAALDTLVGQGFIEIKGAQAAAATSSAPAASKAPSVGATQPMPSPAAPAQTREQAMSALTRVLIDNLGPDAGVVTGPLERARTRADFLAAAERGAHTMAARCGASTAQDFRDRAKAFEQQFLAGR